MELLLQLDGPFPTLYFGNTARLLPSWKPPLNKEDIEEIRWYLEDYPHHASKHQHSAANQIHQRFEKWGEALYGLVVLPALDIWQAAFALPEPPTFVIESQDAERLSFPFELLRDPESNSWIIDKLAGIVRRAEKQEAGPALKVKEAIRLLVVAPRPYRSDVPLQITTSRLSRLLKNRCVELRVVRPPKFVQLRKLIEQAFAEGKPWHILLFDGHGIILGSKEKQTPALIFNQHPAGGPTFWQAKYLAEIVATNGVQLVLLNACRSARAVVQSDARQHVSHKMDEAPQALGSYAMELNQTAKIPIVAMSHRVLAETASRFTVALLDSWLNGISLIAAMQQACSQLRNHPKPPSYPDQISVHDWIVPTLYGDGTLRLASPVSVKPQSEGCSEDFLGRDSEFKELEETFIDSSMILLFGMIGIGKTALAREFSNWWKLSGGINGRPTTLELTIHGSNELVTLEKKLYEMLEKESIGTDEHFLLVELPSTIIAWSSSDQSQFSKMVRDFSHSSSRSKILFLSRSPLLWLQDENIKITRISLHGLADFGLSYFEDADRFWGGVASANRREMRCLRHIMHLLRGEPWLLQLIHKELTNQTLEMALIKLQIAMAGLLELSAYNGLTVRKTIAEALYDLSEEEMALLKVFAFFPDRFPLSAAEEIVSKIGTQEAWNMADRKTWQSLFDKLIDRGLTTLHMGDVFGLTASLPFWLESFWESQFTEREKIPAIKNEIYSGCMELITSMHSSSAGHKGVNFLATFEPNDRDKLLNSNARSYNPFDDSRKLGAEDLASSSIFLWSGQILKALEYFLKWNDFKNINEALYYVLASWHELSLDVFAEYWAERIRAAAIKNDCSEAQFTLEILERNKSLILFYNTGSLEFIQDYVKPEVDKKIKYPLSLANKILFYGRLLLEADSEKGIVHIRQAKQIFSGLNRFGNVTQCCLVEAEYFMQKLETESARNAFAEAERFLSMESDLSILAEFHSTGLVLAVHESNKGEIDRHEAQLNYVAAKLGGSFPLVALLHRIEILNDQNKYEESFRLVEKGLAQIDSSSTAEPFLPRFLYVRAIAAVNLGNYRLAEQWLTEAENKAAQMGQTRFFCLALFEHAKLLHILGNSSGAYELGMLACQKVKEQPPLVSINIHLQFAEILIEQDKLLLAEELLLDVYPLIEQATPSIQFSWHRTAAHGAYKNENYAKMLAYIQPAIAFNLPQEFEQEEKRAVEMFLFAVLAINESNTELWQGYINRIWVLRKTHMISGDSFCFLAERLQEMGEFHAAWYCLGMARAKMEEISPEFQAEVTEWIANAELTGGLEDIKRGEREMLEKNYGSLFQTGN